MAPLGVGSIVAIVLLRLATGWHFYSEGLKKLEPDFSSAPVLRSAVGPLAPMFYSYLPDPYDYAARLASPREAESISVDQLAENTDWQKAYSQRVSEATKGKQIPLAEFPPNGPYSEWAEEIVAGWAEKRDLAAKRTGATDKAEAIYRKHLQNLADYFAANEDEIKLFRHELWRVETMRAEPGAGEIDYLNQRIDDKSAEIYVTSQQWPSDVAILEKNYVAELASLAEAAPKKAELAEQLRTPSPLEWIDFAVTCVVFGIAGCLLLGLCTRLAAIVGIFFLLSIMATQPPWVVGANTQYFGYQLVEVMAFVVLAVVGAGRWFGIDSLFSRPGANCCERQE